MGVLGAGMLPLAQMLNERGCSVTGSDMGTDVSVVDNIPISTHSPEYARSADFTVYSLAIDERDVDIVAAAEAGVPLISRAQLLGALMLDFHVRIGVSGSHGKSTTTALIDAILCEAGLSPTTISGAELRDGIRYRRGTGGILIYEACEYKDSFLSFFPTHQIITSAQLDHTDYFRDLEHIRESFVKCALRASSVVIISDTAQLSERIDKSISVLTYGKNEKCDFSYRIIEKGQGVCRFSVKIGEKQPLYLETPLIGEFNIENISAAMALAYTLGVSADAIARAVRNFRGIRRRLDKIGTVNGRDIFFDYAHHPTEISLAIDALTGIYGECTVIFRPHTYSRTAGLWSDFVASLGQADFTVLVDIYPAREEPIPGITSERLARAIGKSAKYLPTYDAAAYVMANTRGVIVLMGAGDVDMIRQDLLNMNKKKE